MREKAFALIAIVTTLLTSLAIVNPAFADVQPNAAVSVSPVMSTGAIGDTISVDIMITDVEYLYGYEFRLFYDTNTLTATGIDPIAGSTNGPGFFFTNETGQGWQVWKNAIDDDPYGNGTGYAWLAVTRPLAQPGKPAPPPVSGSGKLATVTFSVDLTGAGYLSFDFVILGNPTEAITGFGVFCGYFSNMVPTTFEANLVGKSAWPEHHHFVATKDEDGKQTLYGKVRNTGTAPTRAKINFTMYDESGFQIATLETQTVLLAPGETQNLSLDWDGYTVPMKYSVEAQAWYDSIGDGHAQTAGTKVKPFTFAVV